MLNKQLKTTSTFKMVLFLLMAVALNGTKAFGQSTFSNLDSFKKVIISPHIEVTFEEGLEEKVVIKASKAPQEKINVEVKGETLWVYLEGAKTTTKHEKDQIDSWKVKKPIYKGTVVTAAITYKSLEELSLRGEENFDFKSSIKQDRLRLKIYGESTVNFENLELKDLKTTIYGASKLNVKEGKIDNQKTTCYGECTINTPNIKNRDSKVTAFGEGEFNLQVSDNLKVTAYGEATVNYKGNPSVNKGIILGEAKIIKAD